jgi:FKBP-type peptidyl-prolyl cis-trans isomerase FklB
MEKLALTRVVEYDGSKSMRKTLTTALPLLAAGMMLGTIFAQQTPAPKPKPASPATTKKATTTAKPQASATAKAATAAAPATEKEKISYAIGMNMGKGLQRQPIDIDPKFLVRGLQDTLSGGKLQLTDDEAQKVLTELQGQMRKKQEAKVQELNDANKKEGDAFLAKNKSEPGVVTLPSGLQYKILKEGTGPKPAASDTVECNYRGTLIDGKEFDSSAKHGGQPVSFPVNGVIKGWTEALQLMPVGSKWQLFIPSNLAYGERGAGADIQPGATLIFEVELLSIKGK